MKIKKLFGAAIALAATALMTTGVFAASTYKTGETYVDEGYVYVPVIFESNDYTDLTNFDLVVNYPASKYEFIDVVNNTEEKKGLKMVAKLTVSKVTTSTDGQLNLVGYANADWGIGYLPNATSYNPLFYAVFQPESSDPATQTDFEIKVNKSSAYLESDHVHSITKTDFATYVKYAEVPVAGKIAGSDFEGKFVHKITASFTANGKPVTQDLTNYYEEDDKCVFVLKFVPSETGKKIEVSDLKITAYTSSSESDETANAAEITKTYDSFVVENLQ